MSKKDILRQEHTRQVHETCLEGHTRLRKLLSVKQRTFQLHSVIHHCLLLIRNEEKVSKTNVTILYRVDWQGKRENKNWEIQVSNEEVIRSVNSGVWIYQSISLNCTCFPWLLHWLHPSTTQRYPKWGIKVSSDTYWLRFFFP